MRLRPQSLERKRLWARKERPPRTVYVGSHEDKLSRLGAMRINPDDDGRTREDRAREKTDGRPPPQGGMAGML